MNRPFLWAFRRLLASCIVGAALGLVVAIWGFGIQHQAPPPGESLPQAAAEVILGAAGVAGLLASLLVLPMAFYGFVRQPHSAGLATPAGPPTPAFKPDNIVVAFAGVFAVLGAMMGVVGDFASQGPHDYAMVAASFGLALGMVGMLPGLLWTQLEIWLQGKGRAAQLDEMALRQEIRGVRRRVLSATLIGAAVLGLAGAVCVGGVLWLFSDTLTQSQALRAIVVMGFYGGLGGSFWGAFFGLIIGLLRARRALAWLSQAQGASRA